MNREEALEHFEKTIAKDICEEANREYHRFFQEKREMFAEKLLEGFQKIVEQLENRKDEVEIAYIHFSFLRAHVLDGTYRWFVEAQDEKGVFDRTERSLTIALPEFFEPLENMEKALKKKIHDYAGKITESDIEAIKLREFNRYTGYFYIGGLKAFQNIGQREEYQRLKKAPLFRITLGERKDRCILLHITFPNPMTEEEALEKLYAQPEENDMAKDELTLRDYKGLTIYDRRIVFKNAYYSNFQDVSMDTAEVMFCNLIGTDFRGAEIKNSFINVCTLQDADFRNAVIQDTVMAGNHFETGKYEKDKVLAAGIYPVSFQGAVLKNVDFSTSDLRGCDFSGAKLLNVVFTDADLTGARFERKTVEQLTLSDEQRKSVCIVS